MAYALQANNLEAPEQACRTSTLTHKLTCMHTWLTHVHTGTRLVNRGMLERALPQCASAVLYDIRTVHAHVAHPYTQEEADLEAQFDAATRHVQEQMAHQHHPHQHQVGRALANFPRPPPQPPPGTSTLPWRSGTACVRMWIGATCLGSRQLELGCTARGSSQGHYNGMYGLAPCGTCGT